MARNRKRAKDRGPREPQEAAIARSPADPRAAIARSPGELGGSLQPRRYAAGDELALGGGELAGSDPVLGGGELAGSDPALGGADLASPDPLAHASPDAELAEAQLLLGSQAAQRLGENGAADPARSGIDSARSEAGQAADPDAASRRQAARPDGGARDSALPAPAAPAEPLPLRLIGFLQGSWRELQRVQWPDRRQVMQATWVVIGFVIVAGILLGVSDLLAKRIVDFILYGHFS